MARRHVIASPKRFAPLAASAAIALLGGVMVGARYEPPEKRTVTAFTQAWERGDHRAMYALLSDAARRRTTFERLQRTYQQAADTLTLQRVRAGKVESGGIPITLETRIFGALRGVLVLPTGEREGHDPGVDWSSELVYPGLHDGEKLKRQTTLPERASILARNGQAIAEGPDRLSDLGPLASEIAGRVGPAPKERLPELAKRGIPADAQVGLTGLEREFDERLSGTPGGVLSAGGRVLARKPALRGADLKPKIDPKLQRAAIDALAGRYGGIAAIAPKTGEVLALAGIAQSAPQPPGSVFKIITLAGALQNKAVKRNSTYEVTDRATIEGVDIQNANGEFCGGSLRNSFAHSCNSVFAPLGAKLGAQKLVETAEAFGFNQEPGLSGAARSTIPLPNEIGDDLAVGSSAIGQGKVLATPLLMADVASAIAQDGRRPKPTLLKGAGGAANRATTPETARFIARAMRSVVTDGTGIGAAVPGVKVAGKTGTAELRSTVSEDPIPEDPSRPPQQEDLTDTDAWFTAFAPLRDPKVAVCVLLVGQGAGGATAAPAAKTVIEAALKN